VAWIERRPSKEQYELTRPPDEQQQLSLTERVITSTLLLLLFLCFKDKGQTGQTVFCLVRGLTAINILIPTVEIVQVYSYVLRFGAKKICPPPKNAKKAVWACRFVGSKEDRGSSCNSNNTKLGVLIIIYY
jgi:hypothetical protein